MSTDPVRAIADAVLYEGYILWPYRRSALKNRRRWTFGGVHPRAWSERHPDDEWAMQTQCLVEAPVRGAVEVQVRFLQVIDRRVAGLTPVGREWVSELDIDGEVHLAWEEAAEREVTLAPLALASGRAEACAPLSVSAGRAEEELLDRRGRPRGALVRSWKSIEGSVRVRAQRIAPALWRLAVRVENTTPCEPREREQALQRTLCSTHTVMRAQGAQFVSMTDPPEHLREAAGRCRNIGTWPVLVGAPGSREVMLSSRIILEDHPRIAPESPGDLFDGGEIDQLLLLNILALSEEEKREMRASDPRTREILERTQALSPQELMRLNGAIRELQVVRET